MVTVTWCRRQQSHARDHSRFFCSTRILYLYKNLTGTHTQNRLKKSVPRNRMKQISSIHRFSKLKFNDIRYDDRLLFNFLSRYRGSSNIAWKLMDALEYKRRRIYKHAKWCDTRMIAWRNCFVREFTEEIVYVFIDEMYATSVKMYETIEWKKHELWSKFKSLAIITYFDFEREESISKWDNGLHNACKFNWNCGLIKIIEFLIIA